MNNGVDILRFEDKLDLLVGSMESLSADIDILVADTENTAVQDYENLLPVKDILSVAGAWIWEMDKDLKFIYFSPQIDDFLNNFDEDQNWVMGKNRADLIDGPWIDTIQFHKHKVLLKEKQPFKNFAYPIRIRKDGKTRWVLTSGRPIVDKEDEFCGYWGLARDVTKHMEVHSYNEHRFEELNGALDALHISVLILDDRQCIIFTNERWRSLHSNLDEKFYSHGTDYEKYLREAIRAGCFPDALMNVESFVQERIHKNENPPTDPFLIRRQNGLELWTTVKKTRAITVISSADPHYNFVTQGLM